MKPDEIHKSSRILIIDDDLFSIKITETILSEEFGEMNYCTESDEVFEFVKNFTPDIILLDWNLDDRDGISILKQLKSQKEFQEIPVIVVTGEKKESIFLRHALQNGASDFLRKPLDNFELIARIKSVLEVSYLHHETARQKEKLEKLVSLLINDLIEPFDTIKNIAVNLYEGNIPESEAKESLRQLKSISVNRVALIEDLLKSQGLTF